MPLGKNIKKDTLIPSGKKVKATKAVTKKKTTLKKENIDSTQEIAEQIEEKVVQSLEVSDEAQAVRQKLHSGEYITEKEYQERQRLKAKFDEEVHGYQGKELQLVSFNIGKENYAIDIDAIKEVVPFPSVAKIPHAPDYILGVANIRGVVMVILDLEHKFKLVSKSKQEENKATSEENKPYVVVINGLHFKSGIVVKKVPTTLKVSGDNIVSSSGLLSHTALDETYIKGLIKTEEEMIIYLDIKELVEDDDVKVMSETIAQLK